MNEKFSTASTMAEPTPQAAPTPMLEAESMKRRAMPFYSSGLFFPKSTCTATR